MAITAARINVTLEESDIFVAFSKDILSVGKYNAGKGTGRLTGRKREGAESGCLTARVDLGAVPDVSCVAGPRSNPRSKAVLVYHKRRPQNNTPFGYRVTALVYNDMPEELAEISEPNPDHDTFQLLAHAAAKDGSNLQAGEGSWLDRGMRPSEPGKIRLLVPEDEPMLPHTRNVSEGPFILRVINTNQGYMETVPLSSPQLELVSEGSADSISTSAGQDTKLVPAWQVSGRFAVTQTDQPL
jgi:hypothetical protein